MNREPTPGRRSAAGGPRRFGADETLPGVQFPVVEDLTRITADDEFLDAIAAGGADLRSVFADAAAGTSAGPVAVSDLFGGGRWPVGLGPLLMAWRSELLEPPMPALPTLASRPMLAPADRSRRRSMRSLLSVGIAIGALLMASTAVGARSAQPGQPLWGLSQVLWSDHADSVEAKGKVEAAIDVAKNAIKNGDASAAQQALLIADGEVGKVLPVDGRDALRHDLVALKQQAGQVLNPVDSPPGSVAAIVGSARVGSSGGGVVPPGGAATSRARTTAPTIPSPVLPILVSSGTAVSPTGAPGPGTGAGGNSPSSNPDLPLVPVVPATSSSPPVVPAPVTAADPVTTAAPGTTDASTAPVDPSTPAPVDASAPSTPGPVTTEPPPVPPTTAAPTEPPTTDAPTTNASTTADPSTSSPDPSTSSDEPTLASPTEASTTSELPTTVETTPLTDSDGSTTSDTATTTQTAPVNSTDDLGSTTDDPETQQPDQDPGTDNNSTDAAADAVRSADAAGR